MDFSKLNFGVDGDSITAGEQWSYHVYKELGMASHHNVAVGSSVWYKRTIAYSGGSVTTQGLYFSRFCWHQRRLAEETDDPVELQKRANNCGVVHTQRFIEEVKSGKAPVPDVFAFAMGTNDAEDCLGCPDKALEGKTLEGNESVDLFTEAGAARWCIQRIMEEFPLSAVCSCSHLSRPQHPSITKRDRKDYRGAPQGSGRNEPTGHRLLPQQRYLREVRGDRRHGKISS